MPTSSAGKTSDGKMLAEKVLNEPLERMVGTVNASGETVARHLL